jgi:hypothetical protein
MGNEWNRRRRKTIMRKRRKKTRSSCKCKKQKETDEKSVMVKRIRQLGYMKALCSFKEYEKYKLQFTVIDL